MKFLIRSVIISLFIAHFLSGCTNREPSEEFGPLLDKYVGYWNTGDFQGIEEILHPDFEIRMTPEFEPERGIETFKETVIKWRTAYPDFNIEVSEWVFSTEKVAGLWTITATNSETGKHINVMGISIIHFEEGKIRDEWIASNNLLWMIQLGYKLVPPKTDSE